MTYPKLTDLDLALRNTSPPTRLAARPTLQLHHTQPAVHAARRLATDTSASTAGKDYPSDASASVTSPSPPSPSPSSSSSCSEPTSRNENHTQGGDAHTSRPGTGTTSGRPAGNERHGKELKLPSLTTNTRIPPANQRFFDINATGRCPLISALFPPVVAPSVYNKAAYKRIRQLMLHPPVLCAHCKRRQATTLDHDPPLAMHVHRDGSQCCRLIPACEDCNRRGGTLVAHGRWRPGGEVGLEDPEPERDGLRVSHRRWRMPWLRGLRKVPADATWPRLMSVPHRAAAG